MLGGGGGGAAILSVQQNQCDDKCDKGHDPIIMGYNC